MIRLLLLFILTLPALHITAQHKQAYNWYFGTKAGISFATNPPSPLTDGNLTTNEGCSVISDSAGNLLFYTDGVSVWNRQHTLMQNGSFLLGNSSASQSALIVPWPGDDTRFFIFTVDAIEHQLSNGLNYSVIDMTQAGGLGQVNIKNIKLLDTTTEKLTATRHSNGQDYWVIAHQWPGDAYYAYHISAAGIDPNPVITHIGIDLLRAGGPDNAVGCLKASPDGTRLAAAHYEQHCVEVFHFDAASGIISHPLMLRVDGYLMYGVEFSPNSRRLYTSGTSLQSDRRTIQYNLRAKDINGSAVTVATGSLGALQLGPDGKIYTIAAHNTDSLDVIHKPDELGKACKYEHNSLYLGGKQSIWGLPNFVPSLVYAVKPVITLSNAFTPGDDGFNDVFIPDMEGEPNAYSWEILNRWGQRVFITEDPGQGWDGSFNGQECPAGTYYWTLHYTDTSGKQQRTGTVNLIR